MSEQRNWSRRNFVQVMGATALSARGLASSMAFAQGIGSPKHAVAYAGSGAGTIEVFAIRGGRAEKIQSIASARPAALALAPNGRVLYAANEIAEYRGLPRGTVEAFAINPDGTLTKLNRQELSLSATMPRHMAVSHDGKKLVVAAHGGGVYNTLAIEDDGSVGRVTGILKETGDSDGRTTQPRATAFDRVGRIVSADQGTSRLRTLAHGDGLIPHTLSATQQGDGPRHLAFAPEGKLLFVAHGDSLQSYEYNYEAGHVATMRQHLAFSGVTDGAEVLAVHPSGRSLFACDAGGGVAAWKVNPSTGELKMAGRQAEEMGVLQALALSDDGRYITTINKERGAIWGASLDATGAVSNARLLARVEAPICLQVIYS
ncbi:lactonase family protein [Edaphobacter flagellatus]|uniref:lactonase family protein n=1 Tax=Edaphobacter flagellatus TaxID=1933044 RepID=UPI0021B45641|nr:beta-propeller fold lactonase family protein [Edaphobacter flagellatus]